MNVLCTLVAYATSSAKQPYFGVQQPEWLALHVKIWLCCAVTTPIHHHSFWHSYCSSTQLKRCCECAKRFLGAYMVINTTATVPLSGELYCTTTEKKYLAWNEKLYYQLPHYSPLLAIRRLKVPLLTGTAALLSTCLRTVRTHKSKKKKEKENLPNKFVNKAVTTLWRPWFLLCHAITDVTDFV